MKLTIERAALLKALGHVQSVVERRTTIPILSNVLLHAEGGRLAVCELDRGDALLFERQLSPFDEEQRSPGYARGRDRRSSPGAGRNDGARGRGRDPGDHRATQSHPRTAKAGRGGRGRGRGAD